MIQENKSGTLGCNNDQTLFQPKVFGIGAKESAGMKSDNPKAGFYEADTARTLDANGGNPNCNQGGMAVVAYGIDRAAFNQGKNAKYNISIEEEKNSSIVAKGPSAVAYCARPGNHIAKDVGVECSPPEAARDYKDPLITANNIDYIVRRLTPTECGRLQGFPDSYCKGLEIENPTDEEIAFWDKVFKEYGKPKTEKQIRKWLSEPHTDSAEYKMWGNGCALPNVYYVMWGISQYCKVNNIQ